MAEPSVGERGAEARGELPKTLTLLGAAVAAFVAVDWLAPPGAPLRGGMFVAILVFLLLTLVGLGRLSRSLATRAASSVGLGALAAAIVWLALESRSVVMSVALYFVLWWTLLFTVLPFGVRSQHEGEAVVAGTDPGAPERPSLLLKVFATSFVAAVALMVVLLFLYFRPIPNILPFR